MLDRLQPEDPPPSAPASAPTPAPSPLPSPSHNPPALASLPRTLALPRTDLAPAGTAAAAARPSAAGKTRAPVAPGGLDRPPSVLPSSFSQPLPLRHGGSSSAPLPLLSSATPVTVNGDVDGATPAPLDVDGGLDAGEMVPASQPQLSLSGRGGAAGNSGPADASNPYECDAVTLEDTMPDGTELAAREGAAGVPRVKTTQPWVPPTAVPTPTQPYRRASVTEPAASPATSPRLHMSTLRRSYSHRTRHVAGGRGLRGALAAALNTNDTVPMHPGDTVPLAPSARTSRASTTQPLPMAAVIDVDADDGDPPAPTRMGSLRRVSQSPPPAAAPTAAAVGDGDGGESGDGGDEATTQGFVLQPVSSSGAGNGDDDSDGDGAGRVCDICKNPDNFGDDCILFCDGCDVAVHKDCYHVPAIPAGDWFCQLCEEGLDQSDAECALCPVRGGVRAWRPTTDGTWVHAVCAMWVPEVVCVPRCQLPVDSTRLSPANDKSLVVDNVSKINRQRLLLTCSVCQRKGAGACIQCAHSWCSTAYHPMCALEAGLSCRVFST